MLTLKNISKAFHAGTVNARTAIDNLSLHIPKGDFITLLGGNGSGKTTLLNMIAGVYLADSGRILLDGENITFTAEHKRARLIGRLFQDPIKGTAPNMTIIENLSLAYRKTGKKLLPFFREQLAQLNMGLEDRLKTNVGLLSGGQRQAVTLVMATLCTPKLLLLDEHTAALDPATAEKILHLTKQIITTQQITAIMITHDIPSALAMGNRTLMMKNGRITMDIQGEERKNMTEEKLKLSY
jgi:putative ABC transport system ATP-binding protein